MKLFDVIFFRSDNTQRKDREVDKKHGFSSGKVTKRMHDLSSGKATSRMRHSSSGKVTFVKRMRHPSSGKTSQGTSDVTCSNVPRSR